MKALIASKYNNYDVIVIGGGPAGSTVAAFVFVGWVERLFPKSVLRQKSLRTPNIEHRKIHVA